MDDEALAARYWRAIAANNMVGHVPAALQADAARRACGLYRRRRQPRRVFSSLIQLARRTRDHDLAGAQVAAEEARALLAPDWPAEFRLLLLRLDAQFARMARRHETALALHDEEVRVAEATGDWRLEVIARSNRGDIFWLMGRLDEGVREMKTLMEAVRARPSADTDMMSAYSNALGLLIEMDRIEEASKLAREALPPMRRCGEYILEVWTHLFWRRGQLDIAARLLGAYDAKRLQAYPSQLNEQRLVDRARAGLESEISGDAFAGHFAAGAALGKTELLALIEDGLTSISSRTDVHDGSAGRQAQRNLRIV
jgi:hypothetical protein